MVQEFVSEREKCKVNEFNVGEAKLQVVFYLHGTHKYPGTPRFGIKNKTEQDVVLEKGKITLENISNFEKGLTTVKATTILPWPWALENYFKNLKDGKLEVKIQVEIRGGLTILGNPITTAPATQGQMVVPDCPICFEEMRPAIRKIVQCHREINPLHALERIFQNRQGIDGSARKPVLRQGFGYMIE